MEGRKEKRKKKREKEKPAREREREREGKRRVSKAHFFACQQERDKKKGPVLCGLLRRRDSGLRSDPDTRWLYSVDTMGCRGRESDARETPAGLSSSVHLINGCTANSRACK